MRSPSNARPSTRWCGLALAALAAASACDSGTTTSRPIEPLRGARSPAAKTSLVVNGAGSQGSASGTITSNRGGMSCTVTATGASGKCDQQFRTGTVLSLIARPADGAVFAGFSGCTAAADSPLQCEVEMNESRQVSGAFTPPPSSFTLSVGGGAGGSGRVTSVPAGIDCTITGGVAAATGCRAVLPTGQRVTLNALAAAGSYLKAWAGAGCDAAGSGMGSGSGFCALTMTQPQSVIIGFETAAVVASRGSWNTPIAWPGVAIHAHVLPDGRVMSWGRMDHAPVFWQPATGSLSAGPSTVDIFCSGHALLPNGHLFVTGGHSGTDNQGLTAAVSFDAATNGWVRAPAMQNGRWYPSATTLASGEILTVSGGDTAQQRNLVPEVYQANGTWRVLTNASLYLPYYPFMFVAPNGRVFAAGPSRSTYFLDPSGAGQWYPGQPSLYGGRDYGSAVMYDGDKGKILLVGGGGPTSTAEVIDLSSGGGWRSVGSMAVARRQLNATLLADGRVLVTGGTNSTGFNNAPTNDQVLAAEVWDPATEQWSTLGRMTHHRLYHSTALLLPDARVLSLGSGQPAATGLTDDRTAEVFTPPYLYNADGTLATRPTITSVPTEVGYGQPLSIQTAEAGAVAKVTWIRLGSVTHSFNQSQRMNVLAISPTRTSTSLTVLTPANANLAPPGHYMLFLIDSRGVPSVARIVRIS